MTEQTVDGDVIQSATGRTRLDREPLIVLEPLEAFLDVRGLGSGAMTVQQLGDGHSNVTYLISRASDRFVLRRPPRGPLPPSTHDVLREARLLQPLASTAVRVPEIAATCEDRAVIGAPFYVTRFIDGHVLTKQLPAAYGGADDPRRIAQQLVDALVELHTVDAGATGLAGFARTEGYLERQLRRFRGLLSENATRPLLELEAVADWLDTNQPHQPESTVVHGDYRLGNMMFTAAPAPRLAAVLDWEMATIGAPLADLGYMTAMWAETDDPSDPMLDLSAVTRLSGFPSRSTLAQLYAERSGRDITDLNWYQVLALWKSAIFLEGSYRRYLAGSTEDPYFARLACGVPLLARRAARQALKG